MKEFCYEYTYVADITVTEGLYCIKIALDCKITQSCLNESLNRVQIMLLSYQISLYSIIILKFHFS